MPNHPHLITPGRDRDTVRRRFAHVIGDLQRSANPGAAIRWERVEPPVVIESPKELGRQMRYVVLNPCRADLVADPLCWPWSTHRDVVGAIADPWVTADRLAGALGRARTGAGAAIHGYVSGDPSVAVRGTPFPRAEPAADVAATPLAWVMQAAASATRGQVADIRRRSKTRRVFLGLARRSGWGDTRMLAELCGITPQAVRAHLDSASEAELQAAALCLGDQRLRIADRDVIAVTSFSTRQLRLG